MSVSSVGELIGGKVDFNINHLTPEQGQFQNACAIKMSFVLSQSGGIKIPYISGKMVSGKHGDWYLYKMVDLIKFLKDSYDEPHEEILAPTPEKLLAHKGIVIFEVDL